MFGGEIHTILAFHIAKENGATSPPLVCATE